MTDISRYLSKREDVERLIANAENDKGVEFRRGASLNRDGQRRIGICKDGDGKAYRISPRGIVSLSQVLGIGKNDVFDEENHQVSDHFFMGLGETLNRFLSESSQNRFLRGRLGDVANEIVEFEVASGNECIDAVTPRFLFENSCNALARYNVIGYHRPYAKAFGEFSVGIVIALETALQRIQVDDTVAVGIHIGIDQWKRVTVSGYLFRLVCTNGMVSQERQPFSKNEYFGGDIKTVISSAVAEIIASLPGTLQRFQETKNVKMNDEQVEELLHVLGIGRDIRSTILSVLRKQHPNNQNGNTLYDVTNAITAQANRPEYANDPPHRWLRFMRLGGDVITRVIRCRACGHLHHTEAFHADLLPHTDDKALNAFFEPRR